MHYICTVQQIKDKQIMSTLTNSEFQSITNRLSVINYTDKVVVEDEVGNIIEFDTTGNENHTVEDILCLDGLEYNLTEKQKDILYKMAYDAQESKGAEAFTSDDYTHFTNLISA